MMSRYPKSPKEMAGGIMYFPRMLDKIRLNAQGELGAEYHANLGKSAAADGVCCNFLRVNYADLRDHALKGGSDEDILEWCYARGRRLNEGDLLIWNGFISKFGWNDFATPTLERIKKENGVADRADLQTIGDVMDFEEKRRK